MQRAAAAVVRFWPVVLALWAVAVGVAIFAPPPFQRVAAVDEAVFLPPGSPALLGQELVEQGWPDDSSSRSAVVVVVRPDAPLQQQDRDYANAIGAWLGSPAAPEAFTTVDSPLQDPELATALASDDGHAVLLAVGVGTDPYETATREAIETLRAKLAGDAEPAGLQTYVTGATAIAVDEDQAIQDSVRRTQVLSVLLVVALLYWVFRAPLAPLVPLVTVGAAYVVSLGVVTGLAGLGLDVSYLYETFSIVIVFGAGTDYCLLIMSRFGEELRAGQQAGLDDTPVLRRRTLVATMAVLGGVAASSAASTIVGFSAQSVAQFGLFRTMGPALAVTVAITLVAGVTLTPALVHACGRWLFWPSATGRGPATQAAPLLLRADLGSDADGR